MKTIAAISTAKGVGGIGVVRISGEKAIEIADKIFESLDEKTKLSDLKGYTAKYGKIKHGNEYIDDGVALVFRAPNSYTGEDVVEISCHGGLFLVKRLLRASIEAGAEIADPGEFTKRAFLNGKINLTQAESVMDLISAKSKSANRLAFGAREGRLSKKIEEIKNKLLEIAANLSAWADYPEEDIPIITHEDLTLKFKEISESLSKILENFDTCKVLKEGVKTAIIGKPNVGKSTLMNLLSGTQKSIVTDIPGTTRDVIEETVMLGDIPLLLADTAGVRDTEDIIEKIGVEKSKAQIETSEIVFLVLDISHSISAEDKLLISLCKDKKTIVILNKSDVLKNYSFEISENLGKVIKFSATSGKGLEDLKDAVYDLVGMADLDTFGEAVLNERQFNILTKAKNELDMGVKELRQGLPLDAVTVTVENIIGYFLELTGEKVGEAVLDKVFSRFCVGK